MHNTVLKSEVYHQGFRHLMQTYLQSFANFFTFTKYILKGALSSLREYLATASLLKMMKNAFSFDPKSSFRSQDI